MQLETNRWPPLNSLKVFWFVARYLSMRHAAEELHVTPTAVSHQIRSLESELHTRLFERHARSLTLTTHGEELYRAVGSAFTVLDTGIAAVRGSTATRPITVAASPVFASKWLIPRLQSFEESHPDIEVRLLTFPYVNLNEISCDVGFRYGRGLDQLFSGYVAERLFNVVLEPTCSLKLIRGKQVSKESLSKGPLLHDEDAGKTHWIPGWDTFFNKVLKMPPPRSAVLRFSSSYMVLDAAIAGHGWALAISKLIEHDLAAGRLICPLKLSLPTGAHYWMFCSKSSQFDPNVKTFTRWVWSNTPNGHRA